MSAPAKHLCISQIPQRVVQRLEDRARQVDRGYETPCLETGMSVCSSGHVQFAWGPRQNQTQCMAHRISWLANRGPITDTDGVPAEKVHIRHMCDNPACCNPDHLELGSHAHNVRDRYARGPRQHNQSLLPEEVLGIAWLADNTSLTGREIAAAFLVTPAQVSRILSGKSWGWLTCRT